MPDNPRLLFASYHAYLDQSSGAALSTRDLFEDLAAHGWECRVACGPKLDYEDGRGPADALRARPADCCRALLSVCSGQALCGCTDQAARYSHFVKLMLASMLQR